ncbi:MAG: cadherin domain-containing protein, partial [Gammaproteobacteria bacterium]
EVFVQDPSALDFEKESAVKIEVTATSEDGSTSSESFEISVNDANEFEVSAVTDGDNASNVVSEFASVGDGVGITASAFDADGSDTVSYSLTGNPDNAFAINQETGEVTVADPSGFDYETAQTVQLEITATSSDGTSSVETFAINVANVNEDPVITKIEVSDTVSSFNQYDLVVDDGASIGSFGDNVNVSALQPGNEAAQLVVSSAGIGIDSTNVTNDLAGQIDYDPVTGSSEQLVLEFVNPVTNLQITTGFQFAEEGGVGEQGIWTAYDAQGNVVGTGELDADLGTNVGSNSYEYDIDVTAPIASIVIEANDYSDSDFAVKNIQYNETSEVPLVDGESVDVNISENITNGEAIADVNAFDVEGDTLTYSISGGNEDGAFAIDSESGTVTVADTSAIDAETLSTRTITITVDDGNGGTDSVNFDIDITDVNESPINLNFSGNENITSSGGSNILASGTVVADVSSVIDPDIGDNFTFSLSDDASGKFQINTATGEVSLNADHDNSEAYNDSINVLVTDAAGNTYTESIDIHIGTQGSDVITGGDGNDIIYGLDSSEDVSTGPNLIQNGGFENSSTGWNLDSGPGFQIKSTGDGYGIDASEGSRYLDTDHSPGNMSFSQDVSGVSEGGTYQLSLDAAEYNGYDASLEIYWGGELVGTVEPGTTTMQHFEFEVTGGAGDGSNTLQFVEVGNVDYGGTAVDNIQLVEILESSDELSGGAGDDSIYGGAGEDQINGESGNDQLFGGDDTDTIDGGVGDDIINGGAGNDVLSGGDGNDIFIFDQGDGSDYVDGGAGTGWVDSIDLSNTVDGALDPSSPWQIEVDGEAVDYDINSGLLELGTDVSGVIQFDDGSQLTFENVESLEW